MITLLDYGAGNVRSVRNAIKKLGYSVKDVSSPENILQAEKLIFPGVGNFGSAMQRLADSGYLEPLVRYIQEDRPFLGICLGLQTLFEGSEESIGVNGLGIIKGVVKRFEETSLSIPQIGWNMIVPRKTELFLQGYAYYVNSFYVQPADSSIICATSNYYGEFTGAIQKDNVVAVQFHPEKSGQYGIDFYRRWITC